jgi:hypothetical protein
VKVLSSAFDILLPVFQEVSASLKQGSELAVFANAAFAQLIAGLSNGFGVLRR